MTCRCGNSSKPVLQKNEGQFFFYHFYLPSPPVNWIDWEDLPEPVWEYQYQYFILYINRKIKPMADSQIFYFILKTDWSRSLSLLVSVLLPPGNQGVHPGGERESGGGVRDHLSLSWLRAPHQSSGVRLLLIRWFLPRFLQLHHHHRLGPLHLWLGPGLSPLYLWLRGRRSLGNLIIKIRP